jgi:hypothetical protein
MGKTMERNVALITPSHRGDIERFALLCDSVERHLTHYTKHYVIVNDDDVSHFSPFSSHNRILVPCSRLLPTWLKLLPSVLRKGRRVWWSFRTKPVHGWHIQQLLKISAALELPEQRFCLIDSDNVFVRPFDVGEYASGEKTPLYVDRAAIFADAPLHANWTRNCDRLLGQGPTAFPADDYVGNAIVWNKQTLFDMTRAIEHAAGKTWAHALCSARDFSEYLLYGHFVLNSPRHLAMHEITTTSVASSYWDENPLDATAIAAMVDNMLQSQVALCIESYSHTPVSTIRDAVGLRQRQTGATSNSRTTATKRQFGVELHRG